MNEKQLYTLKEIADELQVNYKTVIFCKNQFHDFIMVKNEGRTPKYPHEYLDFFRLAFALKDEGYNIHDIRRLLSGTHPKPPDLNGWLEGWVQRLNPGWTDGRMDGRMEKWTDGLMDGRMEKWTDGRMDGGTDGGMDGQSGERQIGEVLVNQLNDATPTCTSPPSAPRQSHTDLLETIQNQIESSLARLESRLLSEFSEIIPQVNSALTQYYKVAVELQARIEKVESELGIVAQTTGTELDLEKIQVKLEHVDVDAAGDAGDASGDAGGAGPKRKRIRTFKDPKEYSDSPDLDLVKKSIHEGKPEREAVTHWIQAMQAKHPELTFADMVRILDSAGVPTLTARKGWNRGTLRSLIMAR
ncbi:hypothetical protein JCM31598_25540 [Desulfonatronum parangueonense]